MICYRMVLTTRLGRAIWRWRWAYVAYAILALAEALPDAASAALGATCLPLCIVLWQFQLRLAR